MEKITFNRRLVLKKKKKKKGKIQRIHMEWQPQRPCKLSWRPWENRLYLIGLPKKNGGGWPGIF